MINQASIEKKNFLEKEKNGKQTLPFLVWALSVSMFLMNISSVLVFISMPFFLTTSFVVSGAKAGALEGIVEGFSLLVRTGAGSLSDFVSRRKKFIVWGYLLSLIARILLATSTSVEWVIGSRFMDKLGNGIQASPREALISDVVPEKNIGKAYGLNKMLGVVGSEIGAIIAFFIFLYVDTQSINFLRIFWISVILVGVAVFILSIGIKDPLFLRKRQKQQEKRPRKTFKEIIRVGIGDIKSFSMEYWKVIAVSFLFKLGYFSGAYVILLFHEQKLPSFLGIPLEEKPYLVGPIVMIIQNLTSSLFSLPFGKISDHIDRRIIVGIGLFSLFLSLLCFGFFSSSIIGLILGVALYGVQWGMQGALMALLVTTMPKELHGTGFGVFSTVAGIGVIVANSVFMRPIWEYYSPNAAFLSICFPILLAIFLLIFIHPVKNKKNQEKRLSKAHT